MGVVRSGLPRIAVAATLLATAAAGSADGAPARERLALGDFTPLTVLGRAFEPRERVVVRVRSGSGQVAARVVIAGARGRFVVRFRSIGFGECDVFSVTARGGRGSRATVRHLIPPPCGIVVIP
jgi:hypothetical protein